jgi:hypothetical protein
MRSLSGAGEPTLSDGSENPDFLKKLNKKYSTLCQRMFLI